MDNDDVVYLYYAEKIKIMIEFIRVQPFSKYPADIHNISLRTFVECTSTKKSLFAFAIMKFKKRLLLDVYTILNRI